VSTPGDLSEYSRVHRNFLTGWLPPLLSRAAAERPATTMVDLGCGDGTMIAGLMERGLMPQRVIAVDLSPERVRSAEALAPEVTGVVGDATAVTELPDGCADAVISSQVIEHLPDDRALMREIARLLRPGGWWYVGSVLRGPRAWWIYRHGGRWWLDPTHVREYPDRDAFAAALEADGLATERIRSEPSRYPVTDLALRAAARARVLPLERLPRIYASERSLMRRARAATVPVPGYRLVEAIGHRV
jgi:SAM-dependent methyltransferase